MVGGSSLVPNGCRLFVPLLLAKSRDGSKREGGGGGFTDTFMPDLLSGLRELGVASCRAPTTTGLSWNGIQKYRNAGFSAGDHKCTREATFGIMNWV